MIRKRQVNLQAFNLLKLQNIKSIKCLMGQEEHSLTEKETIEDKKEEKKDIYT